MKKTYINPNLEVIKISSRQQMLAGSLKDNLGNEKKNGEDYAREFDFFDED